ncbi:COQ9 family protein [Arenibacterium sp. CAU 1754]
MTPPNTDIIDTLLDAALPHVPFDGWSEATFSAAVSDAGLDPALARAACPRGAVDLAVAYHARGDAAMLARIETEDLSNLRFRDKIAAAVRFRIEAVEDKEIVRRGTTLFALPQYAPLGAKAIWGTCDLIWNALGDTSDDFNWYSKRATLSAVYSSTVLFWLGDDSAGNTATWDFLDRRIDNVMQIEKLKAEVNKNPLLKPFLAGPNWLMTQIKAPSQNTPSDLPGRWRSSKG